MKIVQHLLLSCVLLAAFNPIVYAEDVPVLDATQDNDVNAADLTNPPPESSDGLASSAPHGTPPSLSMERRVGVLEKQMTARSQVDLLTKIQQLSQQMQELRGQMEVQSHDLKILQEQQRTQYQDLDQRVSQSTGANSKTSAADKTNKTKKATDTEVSIDQSPSATANSASKEVDANSKPVDMLAQQKAYQTAYNLLKNKKYEKAKIALNDFLKEYPSGGYAINSHYWLGEINLLQNNLDQAETEFNKILKNNPNKIKIAEANLKLGFIYFQRQQWSKARSQLKKVTQQFPGTTSAQLASAKLDDLKQQGH